MFNHVVYQWKCIEYELLTIWLENKRQLLNDHFLSRGPIFSHSPKREKQGYTNVPLAKNQRDIKSIYQVLSIRCCFPYSPEKKDRLLN